MIITRAFLAHHDADRYQLRQFDRAFPGGKMRLDDPSDIAQAVDWDVSIGWITRRAIGNDHCDTLRSAWHQLWLAFHRAVGVFGPGPEHAGLRLQLHQDYHTAFLSALDASLAGWLP